MYYHFAILIIFRPFIKLRFIGSHVSPRDVCYQAADAIITLLRSYDQLYTLERTPSFIPYIVMASCILQLVRISNSPSPTSPSSGQDELRQGIQVLSDMTSCHGFAKRAFHILRFFAEQWECGDALGEDVVDNISPEEIRESCFPSSSSFNFFCPSMGNFVQNGAPTSSSALFASFPMQGLPLLAGNEEMEREGFSRVASDDVRSILDL
jgi:hypothetical protein